MPQPATIDLLIRLAHIVSSAVMFGVGIGASWFLLTVVRSGNAAAIAAVTRQAVRAEWVLAAPVAVIQPVTGYLLMQRLGYPLQSSWFAAVAALYIAAGMCWVYLVKTEYRLRDLAAEVAGGASASPEFAGLMRRWRALSAGTFAGVIALFWLMVFRPGTGI